MSIMQPPSSWWSERCDTFFNDTFATKGHQQAEDKPDSHMAKGAYVLL